MRRVAIGILIVLVLAGFGFWLFGPYEEVDLTANFDETRIGPDIDVYFQTREAVFDDITPGTEKRVIWAGDVGQKTALSLLYLHGFSATSEEIRPVPDKIAQELGANLVFTRLTGHGRGGEALAAAKVNDWANDVAEGLAAARRVGEKVVIIALSTGATAAVPAILSPEQARNVAGVVMISPNFGLNTALEPLLTMPAARYWLPPLAGRERQIDVRNPRYETYWTTRYPSVAILPMAALVKAVAKLDVSQTKVPALFWYSPKDQVVRPDVTARIAENWGGPSTVILVDLSEEDDPYAHQITGDIVSPGQTERAIRDMVAWIRATVK